MITLFILYILEVFHITSQRKNTFADSHSRKLFTGGSGSLYKQSFLTVSFLFNRPILLLSTVFHAESSLSANRVQIKGVVLPENVKTERNGPQRHSSIALLECGDNLGIGSELKRSVTNSM